VKVLARPRFVKKPQADEDSFRTERRSGTMLGGGISAVPQHGAHGMQWLTKFSASEGTRFFWNMARGLYPRPPIDPDLAAKETLNQLGPSIVSVDSNAEPTSACGPGQGDVFRAGMHAPQQTSPAARGGVGRTLDRRWAVGWRSSAVR